MAAASARMFVVADATKQVDMLGAFPLPVEIDCFGAAATELHVARLARSLGLTGAIVRRSGQTGDAYLSDGGHYILDCAFGALPEPETLAAGLAAIPGVVDHGLFLGLATAIFVAGADGVRIIGEAK